jgi:hypothetical protein
MEARVVEIEPSLMLTDNENKDLEAKIVANKKRTYQMHLASL